MKRLFIAACLIALTLPSLSANDQRARVLLQAAEAKAKVEGDLPAAIKLYKDAEQEAGPNRALVAQALVKMADAYRALGDRESQKIYQRLVTEFSDQKEAVAIAQSRLEPRLNTSSAPTLKDVAELNASGNVTADGRYATFVNWETGNIAVRDLATGTSRELTARKDFAVYSPAISRDGRLVAYRSSSCVEGQAETPAQSVLCVLSSAGEPNATAKAVLAGVDIREVQPMDWSPDASSIAVVVRRSDGTAQIGVVTVSDRSLKVLQSTDWRGSTRAFFSPDGRYIAFDVPVSDASDQLDVRVVAVDGSHGSTAVQDSSQNVMMGWTPDGRHVLFASDRTGSMGLWAQRVANGKPDGLPRLVHAGLGGALSLGVTKAGALYFGVQSGGVDVETMTVDFVAGKQISSSVRPPLQYVGTNLLPAWSRDGKFLAYVSQRGVSGNGGPIIGIRDSSTGVVRELRPKITYIEPLGWAPDGNRLLTNATDIKGRSGVFTIDVRTGELTFIVQGRFPKYAPDGNRIFYVSPGRLPHSVVERNLMSGAERTITTGEFANFSVSPDGRWLAIARGGVGPAAAEEVVLVATENGETRQLYRVPQGERIPPYIGLPFTPDGQAVVVRKREPNQELWLLPTNGGQPRRIEAAVQGWTFGAGGALSLHPDGRQLAGTRLREDRSVEVRVLENFLSAVK